MEILEDHLWQRRLEGGNSAHSYIMKLKLSLLQDLLSLE